MLRICFMLALVSTVLLACGDSESGSGGPSDFDNGSSGPPVTPVERPLAVPDTTVELQENVSLGKIERRANTAPEAIGTRALLTAACQEDVMVLWTDEETIHASLPCNRFWDDETVRAFSSQEVAIKLTVDATRFQIFVETVPGGQAEFTVGGIWVE